MQWKDEPEVATRLDVHHVAHLYGDRGELLGCVVSYDEAPHVWHGDSVYGHAGAHIGLDCAKRSVMAHLGRTLWADNICGNA